MKFQGLDEEQFRDVGRRFESVLRDEGDLVCRVTDTRAHPVPSRPVRRLDHKDGGKRSQLGVEERVITDEVAADDMGRCPGSAMPDDRHPLPRGHVDQIAYWNPLSRLSTPHLMTIAVDLCGRHARAISPRSRIAAR